MTRFVPSGGDDDRRRRRRSSSSERETRGENKRSSKERERVRNHLGTLNRAILVRNKEPISIQKMLFACGGDVLYVSGTTEFGKNACETVALLRYPATCFEWFTPLAKLSRTVIVRSAKLDML